MKPFVRHGLWVAALVAVFFMGMGIYRLLSLENAKLHAEVTQSSTSVIVKNTEAMDWLQCVATLNQGPSGKTYKSDNFNIPAGREHAILLTDFAAGDGVRFDPLLYTTKEIDLQCGPASQHRVAQFGRK